MEIALINSVNKKVDSLDTLGSAVPTESQNGLYKNKLRRNEVNFLVYGQDNKKSGSVDRQNKNDIIWFLGSIFFKKIIFGLAKTGEKPCSNWT